MGLHRVLDWIFVVYFATHIPITIFIDTQAIMPRSLYPQVLLDLVAWYAREFRDPMMMEPPPWYKSFVTCELAFQFPFFFKATKAFLEGYRKNLWIRVPALVYATHVATTLVAIFYHILFNNFMGGRYPGPDTNEQKLRLLSIYAPYLIVPLLIIARTFYGKEHLEEEAKKRK